MTELMGLTPAEMPKHKNEGAEYPKWVEPHHSLVLKDEDGTISVADFEWHVDRHGKVTVLVKSFADEVHATQAPSPIPPQIGLQTE